MEFAGEAAVDLRAGRDIALVILIIEASILSLAPLAAFYFGIRGMQALRRRLDLLIPRVQGHLHRVAWGSERASGCMVRPIVALCSLWAQIQGTKRALVRGAASPGVRRHWGHSFRSTTKRDTR